MILTDRDIIKLANKKDIVILPFYKECVTGVGYDLRIGIIKPLNEFESFYQDEKIIKIPPKCYCIVITEEFVWLSKRLIGTLHSKGTLAAKGLYTNSTNVDPNFKGQMIMSVYNISDVDIIINKDSPTFITLIFHSVQTPTKKLVGEEGTKNSTRVLYQMQNEIYTDRVVHSTQREIISDLLAYMSQKNHEVSPPFESMISKVKAVINPFRKEKFTNYREKILNIFKFSLSNLFKIIAFCFVLYFLYGIFMQLYKTKKLGTEDARALVLLLVAIIGLAGNFFDKKK